ncbi:uncharacterized protein LOC141525469 [Cotesia typhae]|uniref:uncharacterized protein LOC141525469 n=1 Tax=Cotesia typhae TaxID=2053667 RepID=UPI003D686610
MKISLIIKFDLIKKKLENGELITSDDRTLEIDVFNRQFKALLGLERGKGYRLSKTLSSTTDELKMIARNASLLLVTKVGKKSDSATEIRSVNLSAFDSIQPKSVLSTNRNRRTFEYVCRVDEIPAIQRRDLQIFEPNDELGRHDLAKVPSESPEPDYVSYGWGSDFDDYSDDTTETNYGSKDSIPEQHLYQNIDELLEGKSG